MNAGGALSCIVFDIDDTLYPEREYVLSGFAAVGAWLERERGIVGFGREAWKEFRSGARGDVFDRAFRALEHVGTRSLVEQCVQVYRAHIPRIHLAADARRCVAELAGRSAMAAVTDGPLESQRAKVEALGLHRWMRPIVFTAELGDGRGKPDPAAFRRVERETSCRGKRCVYIGDNPVKDFGGPRALRWWTIRVKRAGGLYAALPSIEGTVDREIADLTQLTTVLREMRVACREN